MLGVLPSYTALGMAALLPHQTLAYKDNANPDVLVDGHLVPRWRRAASTSSFEGVAIKADDLLALGKDKGRELVRDKRVVYVYHDLHRHDRRQAGSETKTFEAVAQTPDRSCSRCSASSSTA